MEMERQQCPDTQEAEPMLALVSLVAQTVKRLPTMRETWVQSLGREDLLEKEMATHSRIPAWKIPWTEEPGRLQSVHGVEKSRNRLSDFTFTFCFLEERIRIGRHMNKLTPCDQKCSFFPRKYQSMMYMASSGPSNTTKQLALRLACCG